MSLYKDNMRDGDGSDHSRSHTAMTSRDPPSSRLTRRELYEDVDTQAPNEVPKVYGNEADTPVAMESEVFESNGAARIQQRQKGHQADETGCWYTFWNGMRAIWTTRQTVDTAYDKRLYTKLTLREMIIYFFFLADICFPFGPMDTKSYYLARAMQSLFLDEPIGSSGKTFRNMDAMDDFWEYAKGPLLKGLYWEHWQHSKNASNDQLGYVYYENKLLGLPRLRMMKVKPDTCSVPPAVRKHVARCYGSYSDENEDRAPFGLADSDAWIYKTETRLGGMPYRGLISTYGGGGFTHVLSRSYNESLAIISDLEQSQWIDRGTRAVFIDFAVHNGNINFFCIVKLIIEFPSVGGLIPSWSYRTVRLIRYFTTFDYVVMAFEGLFCAFVLYYIVEEAIEIAKHRSYYFYSFFNHLDIIIILIALACIAFSAYREIMVRSELDDLLDNADSFVDFDFLASAELHCNDAMAFMVFFAWIKVLKYVNLDRTMYQLMVTLVRCGKDVFGLALIFFIFFMAYAQMGYLLFGTQLREFCTLLDSVLTLLRTLMGEFNYELEKVDPVLGPIFLVTYVFFVFFILLNMFVAVLCDSYGRVKAELAGSNAFDLGDYFRHGYDSLLRALGLKQRALEDAQHALQSMDRNNDKAVDLHEWQTQLSKRGFTDEQIEGTFARYDLDSDRVLDEVEQRRMCLDIEREARLDDATRLGDRGSSAHVVHFKSLARRVDHLEHCIGSVANKIDTVLMKLEVVEMKRGTNHFQQEHTNESRTNLRSQQVGIDDRFPSAESRKTLPVIINGQD